MPDSHSEIVVAVPHEVLLQLQLFRRQYLQLLDIQHLTWPSLDHLRNYNVQQWLYENCFQESDKHVLPPERYRLRILKPLLARIEKAIVDPEEDVSVDYSFFVFSFAIINPSSQVASPSAF